MELFVSQSIEDQVTLATSCIIIWYTQNLLRMVCHLDKHYGKIRSNQIFKRLICFHQTGLPVCTLGLSLQKMNTYRWKKIFRNQRKTSYPRKSPSSKHSLENIKNAFGKHWILFLFIKKLKNVFNKNWIISYRRNKSLHQIITNHLLLKSKRKFSECLLIQYI